MRNAISQGVLQGRRKQRKKTRRRSAGQGWKEWERERVPCWPRSEGTAWQSEGSQETAGKKEQQGEKRAAHRKSTERSEQQETRRRRRRKLQVDED